MIIRESISLPGPKSDFYRNQLDKKSNAKLNSFLFLFSDHHYHHHHHHRHHRHHHHHHTYYRFTSNSASSVLRILEERVFAVGSNHQQDHHHQHQRSHWNCCFTLFELLGNMLRVISIKSTKIIPIMIITFSWELLAICLAFFPPSDTFFPYLLSFIQKVSTEVFNLQKRRWGVGVATKVIFQWRRLS